MVWRPRSAALIGFDPELVEALAPRYVRQLTSLSLSALVPSAMIGAAAGYGIWLVEASMVLAVLVAIGFALLVLNLLRVAVAGGGAGPHLSPDEAARWRPRWTPVLVFTLLSVFFAQPAMLPWHAEALAPAIEDYRATMIARHEAALEQAHVRVDGSELANYARHVESSAFAVRRIQLLWEQPSGPGQFTAWFCLIALLPLWLARGPRLAAVRAYESERHRRTRELVIAQHDEARAAAQALLEDFASYRGPSQLPFFDPPFRRVPMPASGRDDVRELAADELFRVPRRGDQ